MLIARGRIPGWHLSASVPLWQNEISKVAAISVYVPQVSHTCTLSFWEALYVSKWILSSASTASALGTRESKILCISFKSSYLVQLSGSNKSDPHWPSKPNVLELVFLVQITLAEELNMGLGSLSWRYPLQLFILPFLGYPLGFVDLDYIVSAILPCILFWFLLYIFSCISFLLIFRSFSLIAALYTVIKSVCLWEYMSSEFFYFTIFEQYILYQFYPQGPQHNSSHASVIHSSQKETKCTFKLQQFKKSLTKELSQSMSKVKRKHMEQ